MKREQQIKSCATWSYQISASAKIYFRKFRRRYLRKATYYTNGAKDWSRLTRVYWAVLDGQTKANTVKQLGTVKKLTLIEAIQPYITNLAYIVCHISKPGGYMPFDGTVGGFSVQPKDKLLVYKITRKIKEFIERTQLK